MLPSVVVPVPLKRILSPTIAGFGEMLKILEEACAADAVEDSIAEINVNANRVIKRLLKLLAFFKYILFRPEVLIDFYLKHVASKD